MKEVIPQNCGGCSLCSKSSNQMVAFKLGWLPKKLVMRFFDYGETQMRQLEKEHLLEMSKINSRKFYSVKSILNLIEKHKN